tara:strand:+ start:217 stop:522 length:306 start_codon:yes stop_codon:yes gene_type:complete
MNIIKAVETDIYTEGWCVYGKTLSKDYKSYMFNGKTGDVFTIDGKIKVGKFGQDLTSDKPYIYMDSCKYIRLAPESNEIVKNSEIAKRCYSMYLENEADDV